MKNTLILLGLITTKPQMVQEQEILQVILPV